MDGVQGDQDFLHKIFQFKRLLVNDLVEFPVFTLNVFFKLDQLMKRFSKVTTKTVSRIVA